jgi:hypothetical protein
MQPQLVQQFIYIYCYFTVDWIAQQNNISNDSIIYYHLVCQFYLSMDTTPQELVKAPPSPMV